MARSSAESDRVTSFASSIALRNALKSRQTNGVDVRALGTARSESTGADTAGSPDEAIGTAKGQVLTTQANFVRVLVHPATLSVQEKRVRLKQIESARMRAQEAGQSCSVPDDLDLGAPVEVLCTVRALLKKMNQRVLVGDRVSLTGLDWVDQRGMVDDVAQRDSEYPYPGRLSLGECATLCSFVVCMSCLHFCKRLLAVLGG